MGRQAVEFDTTLDPLVEQVVDLTKYAWVFRYPGDAAIPTAEEAAEALFRARRMVEEITTRLPSEAHR